jgi:hypothetical protein
MTECYSATTAAAADGGASFACLKLAWFTEPKLAEGERRMVDQIFPRWNPLTSWMRQIEDFQRAA